MPVSEQYDSLIFQDPDEIKTIVISIQYQFDMESIRDSPTAISQSSTPVCRDCPEVICVRRIART